MPKFDGTGPAGQGPKTGRGMGPCGKDIPVIPPKGTTPGIGRGQSRGMGRGRGKR